MLKGRKVLSGVFVGVCCIFNFIFSKESFLVCEGTLVENTQTVSNTKTKSDESMSPELEAFFALPLTEKEVNSLEAIIAFLEYADMDKLIDNRDYLEVFMEELEAMNGLRVLGHVFSKAYVNQQIRTVMDLKKISVFLTFGFVIELRKEIETDLFEKCFSGLLEFLALDRNLIDEYFDQEDYDKIIFHMLYFSKKTNY